MTITAKVIADSIGEHSPRLTTLQCRYPKFIHGEFLTHRVFSRNSSSSRAIPVKRLIQDVMDDPVIPIHWGANQKGMQADQECNDKVFSLCTDNGQYYWESNEETWLSARDAAIEYATAFDKAGYHKQIVNRIIEPWCHIHTVVTATEWSNFFALRRHKDAQPEMHALADAIWNAMDQSKPKKLKSEEWHLPYITNKDNLSLLEFRKGEEDADHYSHETDDDRLIRISVARCARVSYLTQEGKQPKIEDDLALYDRLVGSVPLHASPAEHPATPDSFINGWLNPHRHGNLRGWCQHRKFLPGESQ